MTLPVIFNHQPYDGSNVTWNALRLIHRARATGLATRLFLRNEAIDRARAEEPPTGGEVDHEAA